MDKMFKRLLSFAIALFMVLSMVPGSVLEAYAADVIDTEAAETATAPELPTATVTEIENEDLTFALNFKADEVTQAQMDYYGEWVADYVLTVNKDVTFNANGNADGYLGGQYDAYSENWVYVPFEDVTLKAGESIRIMEYAMQQMGYEDAFTYAMIYEQVQDFDCGVFLNEEFLTNNPDFQINLELRMYNPADETESYVIGETYEFDAVACALPSATVTEIENEDLTFALNFKADEVTQAQMDYYGDWYADYVLTVNKTAAFNADGSADGWLSGQYDAYSENWVNVPYDKGNVTLNAGESLRIMAFAAELMGEPGLKYTYKEVYETVKDFDCGVFFDEEFLAANPDLEVTLELRMYNPADETESYVIGETYTFKLTGYVAEIVRGEETVAQYSTVAAALTESVEGDTVRLLKSVTGENAETTILILNERTLDLNGFTLEAVNVVAVTGGAQIIDSTDGEGILMIAKTNLTLPSNSQLPVWIEAEGGFRFVKVQFKFQGTNQEDGSFKFQYYLQGALDGDLKEQLKNVETNGLKIVLRITYAISDGSAATLDLVIPDSKVIEYAGKTTGLFTTIIRGLESLGTATITPCVTYGGIALGNAEDGTFYYTTSTN